MLVMPPEAAGENFRLAAKSTYGSLDYFVKILVVTAKSHTTSLECSDELGLAQKLGSTFVHIEIDFECHWQCAGLRRVSYK